MKFAALAVFALALTGTAAHAADAAPAKTATTQQQRKQHCTAEAAELGLKGKSATNFRRGCLAGGANEAHAKTASSAQLAQREKMKSCAGQAKGKSGDDRHAFMSQCLKGGAAPSA
ncbi:MAG TPA: PsiF family protein [Rudaea sp.]|nr:PsiF family protein [Rudaea sp.]